MEEIFILNNSIIGLGIHPAGEWVAQHNPFLSYGFHWIVILCLLEACACRIISGPSVNTTVDWIGWPRAPLRLQKSDLPLSRIGA